MRTSMYVYVCSLTVSPYFIFYILKENKAIFILKKKNEPHLLSSLKKI